MWAAFLTLVEHCLACLAERQSAGDDWRPTRPPEWPAPDVVLARPALHALCSEAFSAAVGGEVRPCFDALSKVATATGELRARQLTQAVRSAFLLDPAVARATLVAAAKLEASSNPAGAL